MCAKRFASISVRAPTARCLWSHFVTPSPSADIGQPQHSPRSTARSYERTSCALQVRRVGYEEMDSYDSPNVVCRGANHPRGSLRELDGTDDHGSGTISRHSGY